MILLASLPSIPKLTTNPFPSSSSSSATTSSKPSPLAFPNASLSFAPSKFRRSSSTWPLSCTKNEEDGIANELFDSFSVLSSDIPWDSDNIWSMFAAYFFILHIPLSYGGLSVTAYILQETVLDPLEMVVSAVFLQTTEAVGAIALLYYTAKGPYTFSNFVKGMLNSEQRSWIKASAFGIVFLLGLVLLTSTVADRLVGPKDVNNPILKDILTYSPTSKMTCFVLYCLVAPLLEESIYRGFLLTSLAPRMQWWQAVAVSSGLFSVAHFSAENSLQLFLIGCVLGSVYCWTGNLAASFTVHSLYNATILLVTIMS